MNFARQRVGMATAVLGALLAQTAFFPHVRLFGVVPDVIVITVVAIAAREGAEMGALFGFTTGCIVDLFLEVPLGLSALSYTVVGYGIGSIQSGLLRERWWLAPAMGGAGSLVAATLFVVVGALLGQEHLLELRTFAVIPVRASYDAVLSLVVFPLTARLMGPADTVVAPYRP